MSEGITTVAYIGASILFILSLGGLSNQETARRGNVYGIIGMAIAVLATILATQIDDYTILLGAVVIGAVIGVIAASKVEMTSMPELVAILHSFVGLAAVLVGISSYMAPLHELAGSERLGRAFDQRRVDAVGRDRQQLWSLLGHEIGVRGRSRRMAHSTSAGIGIEQALGRSARLTR